MKVAIHQPHYFPYPGFFHKLSLADVFVIMDNTQYDKRYTNRNRIITPNGWVWLTVPINKEHKFNPVSKVEINNELDWKKIHWNKIHHSYSNSKFFHLYAQYFEDLFKKDWTSLFELDLETTKQVMKWLGIKTKLILESELKVNGTATQRLVNICKNLGADTYISGSGGRNYLDEKLFEKNNLLLGYQKYTCHPYCQHLSESFVPDLSIIDALANLGPGTMQITSNKFAETPLVV